MGIKGLHKLLRKECPSIYEKVHISIYKYKKIAIDISLYIHKFKIINPHRWIQSFINLICCLRKNNVHCVFIYDGKAPIEKSQEKQDRQEKKQKLHHKVATFNDHLSKYYQNNEIDQELIDLYNKREGKDTDNIDVDIKLLEMYIKKMGNYVVEITPKDFQITKELFDILDIPYINAPEEAETLCAQLCKKGIVDAVLSEDTDLLAYGTPTFLFNIDLNTGECDCINMDNLLENIEMTQEQFTDLCIMCGTDYNKNIAKVGPVNSLKLIRQHNSIDNIPMDVEILNHNRIRNIFSNMGNTDNLRVKFCGSPDFDKVDMFIAKYNVSVFNVDYLRKVFTEVKLTFEE